MAESLAPVDETVKIPAAVRAAAEAAEAFYKQPESSPAPEPANEPANSPDPEPQAAAPAAEPPPPEPAKEPAPEVNWEHRYRSMEGRVKQLTEINANLGNQLQNLSTAVTQMQQPQQPTRPLVTEEERKAYGDDLLSVVERQALQAVSPHLTNLAAENERLKARVARDEANAIYAVLDAQLPGWREINTHPDFLTWLNLPDLYSGAVKAGMLRAAFAAGDTVRVLAFFRGFLAEHPEYRGQSPHAAPAAQPPARQAARDLKDFAAPGKARPATGNAPVEPVDKPVYTTTQIDKFYDDVRKGIYAGRVDQKNAEEAKIFAAIRDGRVRRVKR